MLIKGLHNLFNTHQRPLPSCGENQSKCSAPFATKWPHNRERLFWKVICGRRSTSLRLPPVRSHWRTIVWEASETLIAVYFHEGFWNLPKMMFDYERMWKVAWHPPQVWPLSNTHFCHKLARSHKWWTGRSETVSPPMSFYSWNCLCFVGRLVVMHIGGCIFRSEWVVDGRSTLRDLDVSIREVCQRLWRVSSKTATRSMCRRVVMCRRNVKVMQCVPCRGACLWEGCSVCFLLMLSSHSLMRCEIHSRHQADRALDISETFIFHIWESRLRGRKQGNRLTTSKALRGWWVCTQSEPRFMLFQWDELQ